MRKYILPISKRILISDCQVIFAFMTSENLYKSSSQHLSTTIDFTFISFSAFSTCPFETSHRGDSGINLTKVILKNSYQQFTAIFKYRHKRSVLLNDVVTERSAFFVSLFLIFFWGGGVFVCLFVYLFVCLFFVCFFGGVYWYCLLLFRHSYSYSYKKKLLKSEYFLKIVNDVNLFSRYRKAKYSKMIKTFRPST